MKEWIKNLFREKSLIERPSKAVEIFSWILFIIIMGLFILQWLGYNFFTSPESCDSGSFICIEK